MNTFRAITTAVLLAPLAILPAAVADEPATPARQHTARIVTAEYSPAQEPVSVVPVQRWRYRAYYGGYSPYYSYARPYRAYYRPYYGDWGAYRPYVYRPHIYRPYVYGYPYTYGYYYNPWYFGYGPRYY